MNGKKRDCAGLSNDSSSLESCLQGVQKNCCRAAAYLQTSSLQKMLTTRHTQLKYPFHVQEDAA